MITQAQINRRSLSSFNGQRTRRGLAPVNARQYASVVNARNAGRADTY